MPSADIGDIDIYCTHSDLIDELGSERKLRKILPAEPNNTDDPTATLREQALRDVLKALARRTPPILQAQLTVPSELKDAIVYSTLMRLYRGGITSDGDVNSIMWKHYRDAFSAELQGMRLTVEDTASVDVFSIPIFRR